MLHIHSKQFYPNLKIEFSVQNTGYKNHPVIFVWEDQKISQNIKIDYIELTDGINYFSSIEKNIKDFDSNVKFLIICASSLKVLFEETFINLSFIQGNNILYFSQNTYTGYGYAARNYIYQLLNNGFNVQWKFIGDGNDYAFSREEEYLVRNCCYNELKSIDSIIVHHTPEIFKLIADKYPRINVYGLTTWEGDSIPYEWVNHCQNVNTLIVPSFFNKTTFESSMFRLNSICGLENVVVWNHSIFPFKPSKSTVYNSFVSKCESLSKLSEDINGILKNKTVYYNISEFTPRKNLEQVIHCFCKKFKKSDDVCLLIKTHTQLYDKNNVYIKHKISNILKNYDQNTLPDIIFCFDRKLSDNEIQIIHEIGDIYFTLNRGEGFGLATYTAKQIGNLIICGKFGAEKEYLDPNVDILLDYTFEYCPEYKIQSKLYDGLKIPLYDTDYVMSKMISKRIKKQI